ncbi:MAG: type II toxin-antitoxin system ParD family antitoxin [Gammaproteobacteria bacterium]|nr:type II toxin-antitoxin system ParD family antitoxin [Gammaproteobacteria bacterium]
MGAAPAHECAARRIQIEPCRVWRLRQILQTSTFHRETPRQTRHVALTDHQARLVEKLVSSGRYPSPSEVLRLIEDREAQDRARRQALHAAARSGIVDTAGRLAALNRPPRSATI